MLPLQNLYIEKLRYLTKTLPFYGSKKVAIPCGNLGVLSLEKKPCTLLKPCYFEVCDLSLILAFFKYSTSPLSHPFFGTLTAPFLERSTYLNP